LSQISLLIDGRETLVPAGVTVAAALAIAGSPVTRYSVTGEPRAPFCGMGICFECRVTINGRAHCRACQTYVAEGMEIVSE
jgi:predicted molibdopterin-dependent oxidoreductase YjgC